MTLGLVLTALGLGFRHGVDWDHLAAIADLSASADSRRRGFVLSFLYAAGHAVVVFSLGIVAIVFGSRLPEGVDGWMGRVVGITLIAMGVWTIVDLFARRRDFRLRSRWMLVLDGTFAGMRRVRDTKGGRRVEVEHSHDHEHHTEPDDIADLPHEHERSHDHAHLRHDVTAGETVGAGRAPGRRSWRNVVAHQHQHAHGHAHGHQLNLVENPTTQVGNGTATAVGLLHGIGFESPTQIAIFVASTAVVGAGAGVVLLAAWVAGLLIANSLIAVLASCGLMQAERNFAVYATVAVVVGLISIGTGVLLVQGMEILPEILT